jgi:hypothetical protein
MFALPAGGQTVLSDFEDGTLQGWMSNDSLEGEIYVTTGGNPGYCMAATDTGERSVRAVAPPEFAGDLSGYSGVKWDTFVPDKGSLTVQRTFIILQSTNLTRFRSTYDIAQIPIETWNTRFAPFRAEHWEFIHGTESFEDVLRDVDALKINMETANGLGIESYVDNVTLIPKPPYEAAVEKINYAIAQKTGAIEKINVAIDSEMAAIGELNELLQDIPEDLTRRDIFRAKLHILHSVRRQIKARIELRKGISQLRQALENLQAPLPPPSPEPASLPTGPTGGSRRILERDPASRQLRPR